MSDGAARRLVRTAGCLTRLPVLADAYAAGTLSGRPGRAITARVRPRHVALFAEHESALIPTWAPLDIDATTTVVKDWSEKADAVLETDEPTGSARSKLHHNEVGDRGRLDSDLTGDDTHDREALPPAGAIAFPTSGAGADRRDADALVDMGRAATPKSAPGRTGRALRRRSRRPRAAGAGHRCRRRARRLPRQPVDHRRRAGLVPGGLARRLTPGAGSATTLTGHDLSPALAAAFCCDATMRRVVSAGSTVLDYGRPMPTLPRSVRDAVILRDRRCRFRGCARTVDWCEVHHVRHREHGGPDSVTNCALFCARHHHVLHRDGWSATLDTDGTLTVTDPHGRRGPHDHPGPGNGPAPPQLTYGA